MWRRPWLLFGIGVLTTVVVMATLAASALVRVQRQHQILRELERLGAGYEYKDEEDPWQIPFAWRYPREVSIEVDANACDLHAVLKLANQLLEVHELKVLNAHVLPQFPIDQIATLVQLRDLYLNGAKITHDDLDRLDNLPELGTLRLVGAPLHYDQVRAWHKVHPQVSVGWSPPLTREQHQAVANLKQQGITLYDHDSMLSIEPSCCWSIRLAGAPRVWQELSQIGYIRTVILEDMQYVDWDLRQLAKLPGVQTAVLAKTSITPDGLAALNDLPKLDEVCIYHCDISIAEAMQLWKQQPQLKVSIGTRAGPRFDKSKDWLPNYPHPPPFASFDELRLPTRLAPPGSPPTASPASNAIP